MVIANSVRPSVLISWVSNPTLVIIRVVFSLTPFNTNSPFSSVATPVFLLFTVTVAPATGSPFAFTTFPFTFPGGGGGGWVRSADGDAVAGIGLITTILSTIL